MNKSATIDFATAAPPKLQAFDGANVLLRDTDVCRGGYHLILRKR